MYDYPVWYSMFNFLEFGLDFRINPVLGVSMISFDFSSTAENR